MRILSHKDIVNIPGKLARYSVVLEAINDECNEFLLHIRAVGLGGGTLYGARGEPRTFKSVNKAIAYIRDNLDINEITISLKPRSGDSGRNEQAGGRKERGARKRDAPVGAAPDRKKRNT